MGILTWILLFILNAIFAIANYKYENYNTAMFNSFTTGISLVMLAQKLIEYYA